MSRGITETEVWKACDELLQNGARPTIERVRQHLGRGSPNTVAPMLDAWFRGLGGRLLGAGAATAAAPDPVTQAANQLWELALTHTRQELEQRVEAGVAAARSERDQARAAAEASEADAERWRQALAAMEQRLSERERAWDQERLARVALQQQLADGRARTDELAQRLARQEALGQQQADSARQEVALAQQRGAAAERRAALEIEHERQLRAKADKRAEALERKLEQALKAAHAERVGHAEQVARLAAEGAGLHQQLLAAAQREEARTQRLERELAALAEQHRQQRERLQSEWSAQLAEALDPRRRRQRRRRGHHPPRSAAANSDAPRSAAADPDPPPDPRLP